MIEKKINYSKDKVSKIKSIYNQALVDIDKIRRDRDEKIKSLIHKIDKKSIDKILQDIKNVD